MIGCSDAAMKKMGIWCCGVFFFLFTILAQGWATLGNQALAAAAATAAGSELRLTLAPDSLAPSAAETVIWVLASHKNQVLAAPDERHSEKLVIQLPASLSQYFTGVVPAPERPKAVSVFSARVGNQLNVDLVDSGVGPYHYSEIPTRYFGLRFSQILAGNHQFGFSSAKFLDASNQELLHWSLRASAESLTVSPPYFTSTTDLKNGVAGEFFIETLKVANFEGPVQFFVTGGALPGGLSLDPRGAIVGKPLQTGLFSFSVVAKGADGSQVTSPFRITVVDLLVKPEAVLFKDQDASGTVNAGDLLRVVLSNPVTIGSNIAQAVVPARVGDTFGTGARYSVAPGSSVIEVTLGASPQLSLPGGSSAISVNGAVSKGIRDLNSRAVSSATLQLDWFSSNLGREDWWVGKPIRQIWVGNPNQTISGLPSGLTYQNGVISGVPTQPGKGRVEVSPASDPNRLTAVFGYTVLPQGSEGLYVPEPIAPVVYQGSVLGLDIVAFDTLAATEVWIGSTRLIPIPSAVGSIPLYWIVPETASTGQLVVRQSNGAVFSGPQIQVRVATTSTSLNPVIQSARVIVDSASGKDFVHLTGSGFTMAEVSAEGIGLRVVSQGNSYLVAEFSAAVPMGQVNIEVSNPLSPFFFFGLSPLVSGASVQRTSGDPLPTNVPGPGAGAAAQREQFNQIMDRVNQELGLEGGQATNGTNYFYFVCNHESGGFAHRSQICQDGSVGPGTGVPQIEPKSAADAIDRNCSREGRHNKRCCEKLKEAINEMYPPSTPGGSSSADSMMREVAALLDKGAQNKWSDSSVLEGAMKTHPNADYFALLLARCKERLNVNSIPDSGLMDQEYFRKISEFWAENWWAGAKKGSAEFNEKAKEFEKKAESAQKSLK